MIVVAAQSEFAAILEPRLAHELGASRTGLICYRTDTSAEGQCTMLTERQGKLAGQHVVPGYEDESVAA